MCTVIVCLSKAVAPLRNLFTAASPAPGEQLRLACQFENRLDVTILPPYVPSEQERGSPAAYAKSVQRLYAQALGVPIVDQVR